MVEQRFCKAEVKGSSPFFGSFDKYINLFSIYNLWKTPLAQKNLHATMYI